MKLGIIARSDKTGLGNQTYELTKMLNPDKVLLINSFYFNKNKQFPENYAGYDVTESSRGFLTDEEVRNFLKDIDVVLSCETFYNGNFIRIAKELGVKTILQYNFEFLSNLTNPKLPTPDVFIAPSMWNFDTVCNKFGNVSEVVFLPPPTSVEKFAKAKEINAKEHKKILHVAGKIADADRNGTNTVLEMLKHSVADYELVVKVQNPEKLGSVPSDPRLRIDSSNPNNSADLYVGFDAMVLPRRYAGLCLPMNEALISGLPVFMTNVSPNNLVLPKDWLISSKQIGKIKTRTILPVYAGDAAELGGMIDEYLNNEEKQKEKEKAFTIGTQTFSPESLKEKYLKIIKE